MRYGLFSFELKRGDGPTNRPTRTDCQILECGVYLFSDQLNVCITESNEVGGNFYF